MKRSLFLQLSVLVVLIVFVTACSKKTEYTNAIPADATQVLAINLKSLAEKAGINDKDNKESLKKLTDAMKSGMNAATFQQVEAIMNNPSQSGIDVSAPVFLFSAPTFDYTTIAAKVSNEDDLKKLLEIMQKEQISTPITEADGYSFVRIDEQALLAFNSSTLLVVNYKGTSQLEEIQKAIPALLKQTEENSIVGNAAFKKMQKMNGDINMLLSSSKMLDAYTGQLNNGLLQSMNLKDMITLGSLSFEKGKIEMQIELYTENAQSKALLEKQVKSTSPVENTFLKYFPKSTVALFSIGVNGDELYNVIQENEMFRNQFTITKAAEVKNLFSTFQKDLTVGLINITLDNGPSLLAYASIKNDAPLKAIYEKKGELGLKRGSDIVKLNENDYLFKSPDINIFFGVRDKQLYATNNELLYKNICKADNPSAKDADYASEIKGKRFAFVINAEAVLELPVVKMLAGFGGAEYSTYYSLANHVSYFEAVSEADKATLTLQLKDKKVNSLKQIVNFIKEFAGM